MKFFTLSDLPEVPWKNGGGTTIELVAWPEGSTLEDFDWRISVANITRNGPFSIFPGIDRTIMLLDGDGVNLSGDITTHRLDRRHHPFEFCGEARIDATLLGSISRDFNLMSRRNRFSPHVTVVRDAIAFQPITHALIMSLEGSWQFGAAMLDHEQGVWWAGASHAANLRPDSADACAVVVALEPLNQVA